jgi:predicted GIY-YIG superfamily endonuclease
MKKFSAPADWLTSIPVHHYPKSFADLASKRLPELQSLLEVQIKNSIPLSLFSQNGIGPASLATTHAIQKHLHCVEKAHALAKEHTRKVLADAGKAANTSEFAGMYVFISSRSPFYVGITRTVYRRVQSHVRSNDHNTASLLFKMVRKDAKHTRPRAELDLQSERAMAIRSWFQNQSVAILPLPCPVERYAFELYASMTLQTGVWNTFETH